MNQKLGPSWVQLAFAEGKAEGEWQAARSFLRMLLADRFGTVPEELGRRIEATADLARLQAAVRQVLHIKRLEDIPL